MELAELVEQLDAYFAVAKVRGDDWQRVVGTAYPDGRWGQAVEAAYLERWNGLMVRGAPAVTEVVTAVFPGEELVAGLGSGTLLFTEHPVELAGGCFAPIRAARLPALKSAGVSVYQVHAPLDHHPELSPSRLLASALGLAHLEEYFPIADGLAGGALVIGDSDRTVTELVALTAEALGQEVPVRLLSSPRRPAGRVAIAAGGGAQVDMLAASRARGCETYVTGNALDDSPLPEVRREVAAFRALAARERVAVIDGTHYGTEKLSQLAMVEWFRRRGGPARFAPGSPGDLRDGELRLDLRERTPADPVRGWVPMYRYDMVVAGRTVGRIDLRLRGTDFLVRYGGLVGYGVDAPHRGHHYAARSLRLLAPVARAHGLVPLWITCNPDNHASRRTCELAGAELVEIVDLPPGCDMYNEGERQKCRYRLDP
jgi:predicted acetyltransferase/putative NIF3 family GTP cyclohydrolase 1 type 2